MFGAVGAREDFSRKTNIVSPTAVPYSRTERTRKTAQLCLTAFTLCAHDRPLPIPEPIGFRLCVVGVRKTVDPYRLRRTTFARYSETPGN